MVKQMALLAAAVGLVVMLGGCCDAEKRALDQMRQDNASLADQLKSCKDELNGKEAELSQLRDDLSNARNQMSSMQAALDKAQKMPALPPGWHAEKGMAMKSLPMQILFDSGKAKLRSGADGQLDKIISEIRGSFAGREVYVMGHTDTDPIRKSKWEDNLELSLQRAATVMRYMIHHGLAAKLVVAAGAGEYRPVASNSTAQGKQSNRRVEFWVK